MYNLEHGYDESDQPGFQLFMMDTLAELQLKIPLRPKKHYNTIIKQTSDRRLI